MSLKRHILRHIAVQEQSTSNPSQDQLTVDVPQPVEADQPADVAAAEEMPAPTDEVAADAVEVKKPAPSLKKKKSTTKSS